MGAYNLDWKWMANRTGSNLTNKFLSHNQDCGCEVESKPSSSATCLYPGIPTPSPLRPRLSPHSYSLISLLTGVTGPCQSRSHTIIVMLRKMQFLVTQRPSHTMVRLVSMTTLKGLLFRYSEAAWEMQGVETRLPRSQKCSIEL